MELHKFFSMIGGDGEASYVKNSSHQRMILKEVRPILDDCIEVLIRDMKDRLPNNCIKVADLGCSSGPNAILTMQQIIESIDKIWQITNRESPTIQYFLNDLFSNDFNIIFKGMPKFYEKLEKENGRPYGSCLVAAMPGTFYGKLFPDNSMHFVHSSYCLQWLSQVPSELTTELGMTMNKGSIYCGKTSPEIVHQAYRDQFTQDFNMFLRMRSQEMIQDGHLLLTFLCDNSEEVEGSNYLHLMGMALNDLGYIKEEELESFNLPIYKASVDEIKQVIQNEGSFRILRLQTFRSRLDASFKTTTARRHHNGAGSDDEDLARAKYVATYLRAIFESVLANHFGEGIMDDLFSKFASRLLNVLHLGQATINTIVVSLRRE